MLYKSLVGQCELQHNPSVISFVRLISLRLDKIKMNKYHLRHLGTTTTFAPVSRCLETNTATCDNLNYGTDYNKCPIGCHYTKGSFWCHVIDTKGAILLVKL